MTRVLTRLTPIFLILSVLLLTVPLGASESDRPSAPPSVPSVTATSLHQWLLDRMMSWMPPGRSFIKEAKETKQEGTVRYADIADDMISVAYDPSEKPLFAGKYGRAMTLALVASLSWFESGYRKDVDFGLGKLGRGDSGRSWCLMQIMLGRPDPATGETKKRVLLTASSFSLVSPGEAGWDQAYGGEHLVQDRQRCLRTGLHMARRSFNACRSLPVEDRLSVYASGDCRRGRKKSRQRVKKAQRWLASSRPPLTDAEVKKLLHPPPPAQSAPEEGPPGTVSFLPGRTRAALAFLPAP